MERIFWNDFYLPNFLFQKHPLLFILETFFITELLFQNHLKL